ncbi:MAG: 2-oxoglutarate dehydrogenase complex dihydrolipoyllysine-residue succinyltransferase [Bacteroidales bacterium]|nr:2-oxoglutarate dehydrogenase complex dihydrolipoyllysine-residue succinyltransferase [Bacteroidales bacterium]
MTIEIRIPSPGESVTEVAIGRWLVEDNEYVEKDQEVAEVETDKATLPLISPEAGVIQILVRPGKKLQAGDVACKVHTEVRTDIPGEGSKTGKRTGSGGKQNDSSSDAAKKATREQATGISSHSPKKQHDQIKVTPLAKKVMEENNLNLEEIINGLKKLTRREVELVIQNTSLPDDSIPSADPGERSKQITPMSPLRRKLSRRLVAVKNETAMLTTFNEVDMSALLGTRKKYQQQFAERFGMKLGLVSFFVKACAAALMDFPRVNSMIDGDQIITPGYVDISFAVQTEKGLMVPVINNAQKLSISEIERSIAILAEKARNGKLSIEEMTGGTFTVTNGGVFGSMLSTPIINPPQSAILGMHNIVKRPVVVQDQIVVRPVMYLALSYDHRLIDGKESVGFLVRVKELIENPAIMMKDDFE